MFNWFSSLRLRIAPPFSNAAKTYTNSYIDLASRHIFATSTPFNSVFEFGLCSIDVDVCILLLFTALKWVDRQPQTTILHLQRADDPKNTIFSSTAAIYIMAAVGSCRRTSISSQIHKQPSVHISCTTYCTMVHKKKTQ